VTVFPNLASSCEKMSLLAENFYFAARYNPSRAMIDYPEESRYAI